MLRGSLILMKVIMMTDDEDDLSDSVISVHDNQTLESLINTQSHPVSLLKF
eukprot:m.108713 g.108713  ORF g.108713 m.108713 type:complete len:51 (+) comp13975_c0_seq2:242-394(+)